MILDSLLSNSPGFLLLASALMLVAYGVGRLIEVCLRVGRHKVSQHQISH